MTGRGREALNRVLLLFGSALIALALAEFGIRWLLPATLGNYLPRYLIDGNPAAALDFYTTDPQLPFALKPRYRKTLVDLAWHPVPHRVTLDEFGYRNKEGAVNQYGLVVVGDSVAFGYGVDDEDTIPAHLAKIASTYSLAIPNAGPEMYMVMIERFLERARAGRLLVLFYEGNDYQNLRDAYWEELRSCTHPGASKVLRMDQPVPYDDGTMQASRLALVRLATGVVRRYLDRRTPEPCELLGVYKQVSAAAIADLDNSENLERKQEENVPRALSYLQQLAAAPCVGETERKGLAEVIRSIEAHETGGLAGRMQKISASLAGKDCYPTGDGFPEKKAGRSLAVYANYYAGFFYEYLASIEIGSDGNLHNFRVLLDQLELVPGLSPQYGRMGDLKKILTERRDAESAREASAEVKAALAELAATCVAPASCDKEGMFLDYLDSLRGRDMDVILFTLPSENALSYYSRHGDSDICKKASERGIRCVDFSERLAEHYRAPGANGLYLDGAHLTEAGSAQVAQWMAAELRLDRVTRIQH